jgi:outer membrane protein TolC
MTSWCQGKARLFASASLVILLSACAVKPAPYTKADFAQQAADDRRDMFSQVEPLPAPLTLSEAVARALKYNLDKRAKMMEEALALGQTDLDRFDMLPKITADAGYAGRNSENISRSIDSVTLQPSAANPTISEDRDRRIADLGMSWNLLDFGVSYYTAHQNADRALVASEQRRKAVQLLVQEVRFAFWRAAAYQVLEPAVQATVADAQAALETARTVENENLKAPVDALQYQKTLLETLQELTAVQQDLSTAQFDLAALINVPPGTEIKLDVPSVMPVPRWTMPLDQMETEAFLNNPDLHEQAYLARIALDETHKAFLSMLPGINLSTSGQYDSNSFLVNKAWYETGATLSWNLINLISGPTRIHYAKTNEEVVKARRLALRMAVLAQVHVAARQFQNAENQYQQADELWSVDDKLAELARARTASNAQGTLDRVLNDTAAIASQVRRFQSFALLEEAHAKIQATLGDDLIPGDTADGSVASINALVARRLSESANGGVAAQPVLAAQ